MHEHNAHVWVLQFRVGTDWDHTYIFVSLHFFQFLPRVHFFVHLILYQIMSLEEGVSLKSELNSDIRTLLAEVREQRRELHSFKEELRGDCLSVKADGKRLKKKQELKWPY